MAKDLTPSAETPKRSNAPRPAPRSRPDVDAVPVSASPEVTATKKAVPTARKPAVQSPVALKTAEAAETPEAAIAQAIEQVTHTQELSRLLDEDKILDHDKIPGAQLEQAEASSPAPVALPVPPIPMTPNPVPQSQASCSSLLASLEKVSQMSIMPSTVFKGFDDLSSFGKANFDALLQANQLLAKGLEQLSKEMVSATQSSIEHATSATKAVFQARSLKDVVELNTDYTKAALDKFLADSSKLTELGVKITTDALAPVTARMNVAVDKVIHPTPVA